MRKFIVKVGRAIYIPTCALMICYCLFYYYLVGFPGLRIIQFIFFLASIFIIVAGLLDHFGIAHTKAKPKLSKNPRIIKFYQRSREIITLSFCYYFFIYLIFSLDRKSIYFNYLVLLLFGLFVGYEIALIANRYKK